MKSNKNKKESFMLPGKITLWDLEVTEKPKKIIEKPVLYTKSSEKSSKTLNSFTDQQEKIIEKYTSNNALNRIIHYCSGGLGIELQYENGYKTHCFNTNGEEEYIKDKQLPVLPMDRITYCKTASVNFNNIQEEKLKGVLQNYSSGKVIKRNGDYNIHVEIENKAISINPLGWVLEYEGCKIAYSEHELEKKEPSKELDINEIQKKVKLGDIIEAKHGKQLIQGEVVRVYNSDYTLNIIFANGTKHTAVPRLAVTKILKTA